MLISIEKRAPADLADLRRFSDEIILIHLFALCIRSVALRAFSVALSVTTVFFFHKKAQSRYEARSILIFEVVQC